MKFHPALFLVLFTFCIPSCKDEPCHNLHYGDLQLDPVSLTFETWNTANVVVCKDIDGNEHRYTLSLDGSHASGNLQTDTCDGNLIFISYNSDYYFRRFTAENSTSISIVQLIDFLPGEQSLEEDHLVDALNLGIFEDTIPQNVLGQISIITSSRQGGIDQESYNSEQFTVLDSLVILNKMYYNVYEQKMGTVKMYYSPQLGIVSFTDNTGTELVLDRIE